MDKLRGLIMKLPVKPSSLTMRPFGGECQGNDFMTVYYVYDCRMVALMDAAEYAMRDQMLAVLHDIAQDPNQPTEVRGFSADSILTDIRDHRHADIMDRTDELQKDLDRAVENTRRAVDELKKAGK